MFRSTLLQALTELKLPLTDRQISEFTSFYDELQRWNQKTNLTAIRDPEEIAVKHFADSLAALRLLPTTPVRLLDIGTGAGFPGIPLKIYRPDLDITLLEPSQKKVAFLRHAVGTLKLDGLSIEPAKLEELAGRSAFHRQFTHAITRALKPDELYDSVPMLLDENGELLLYRTTMLEPDASLGPFRLAKQAMYALPLGYGSRAIAALTVAAGQGAPSTDVPRGTDRGQMV